MAKSHVNIVRNKITDTTSVSLIKQNESNNTFTHTFKGEPTLDEFIEIINFYLQQDKPIINVGFSWVMLRALLRNKFEGQVTEDELDKMTNTLQSSPEFLALVDELEGHVTDYLFDTLDNTLEASGLYEQIKEK